MQPRWQTPIGFMIRQPHAQATGRQRFVGALRRHRHLKTGQCPLRAEFSAVLQNSRLRIAVRVLDRVVHRGVTTGVRISC